MKMYLVHKTIAIKSTCFIQPSAKYISVSQDHHHKNVSVSQDHHKENVPDSKNITKNVPVSQDYHQENVHISQDHQQGHHHK